MEIFTLTVLPGEFSATEKQVLLQAAAPIKQAVSGRKMDHVCAGRTYAGRLMEEPQRNYGARGERGQGDEIFSAVVTSENAA